MYKSGKTIRDIAREFDCQHSTITRHLKKIQVELSEDEEKNRRLVVKLKHATNAVRMGAMNRCLLRDSAEQCVMCLSSIGLGRRVITRIMGIPDGMASNCMRKLGSRNHARNFLKLKSSTVEGQRRRMNQLIARSLRTRVRDALRTKGLKKNTSARQLIGCSIGEFRMHIESKMEKSMNWENYGTVWHIDHIIPCAKFNLVEDQEIKRCFHWTNMRPLYASQNLREKDRRGIHQQQFLLI